VPLPPLLPVLTLTEEFTIQSGSLAECANTDPLRDSVIFGGP